MDLFRIACTFHGLNKESLKKAKVLQLQQTIIEKYRFSSCALLDCALLHSSRMSYVL